MRSLHALSLVVLVPLAACAKGETGDFGDLGEQGSTSSGGMGGSSANAPASGSGGTASTSTKAGPSTTSGASTSSGGGDVPMSCAQANSFVGCCDGTGTLYFCPKSSMKLTSKTCASGQVCGWVASKGYYGCTTAPAGADPGHRYPIECP